MEKLTYMTCMRLITVIKSILILIHAHLKKFCFPLFIRPFKTHQKQGNLLCTSKENTSFSA